MRVALFLTEDYGLLGLLWAEESFGFFTSTRGTTAEVLS